MDLHGQHEHQGLLGPDRHLELLDAFGGHGDDRDAVAAAHRDAVDAEARLARLHELGREGRARAEALRETLREIRGARPETGELDALRRDRAVLQNGSKVGGAARRGDRSARRRRPAVIASAHAAERRVAELGRIDPSLAELAARLASARLELEDVRDTLIAYRDRADFDPSPSRGDRVAAAPPSSGSSSSGGLRRRTR